MDTSTLAAQLLDYMQNNRFTEAYAELFAPDFESIEPDGAPFQRTVGRDGLQARIDFSHSRLKEFHSGYYGAPAVAGNFFAIPMGFEATTVGGNRMKFDEIALYEVKDGKIVREQFFYSPVLPWD